ncbi:MAG TPA: septum formation initiator family protein, partial [Solirubrobacteraceae bacterium]|nr:septum formation initiator family protein [Solirubrobacteraceae bacterium]
EMSSVALRTIHWHRVGRIALLAVLGIILLLYIRPVAHWVQQRNTAANSRQDLQALQAERDRLETRLRSLTGPGAIDRGARSLGMVKAGERAYVYEGH